ncbi:unnamed protein product [Thlaspi arvense]|uniref:Uncharacterized protein n=1 Tax=Thlaspi arvense TaxID=13288 RepID=A0AAU9T6N9_THLAR|nr:unnamed protein product [Thlaspi arvense]
MDSPPAIWKVSAKQLAKSLPLAIAHLSLSRQLNTISKVDYPQEVMLDQRPMLPQELMEALYAKLYDKYTKLKKMLSFQQEKFLNLVSGDKISMVTCRLVNLLSLSNKVRQGCNNIGAASFHNSLGTTSQALH